MVVVGMGELPQAKEFLTALELPTNIDFYTDSEGTFVLTPFLFDINDSDFFVCFTHLDFPWHYCHPLFREEHAIHMPNSNSTFRQILISAASDLFLNIITIFFFCYLVSYSLVTLPRLHSFPLE